MIKIEKVYKFYGIVKNLCLFFSALGIVAMIIMITADVLLRNFFSYGIPGSYEIVESTLMPTAIFWALVITYASGSIPRIDMITNKFSRNLQLIIGIGLIAIDLFIYSSMTYFSWNRAQIALTEGASISAGGTLINIIPFYFFIPIGFLLVTLETIFIFLKVFADKKYYYSIDTNNDPMKE